MSAVGAAAILAETGDPARFSTARAVVEHLALAATQGEIGFDDQSSSKKMLVGTVPMHIVPRRGHNEFRDSRHSRGRWAQTARHRPARPPAVRLPGPGRYRARVTVVLPVSRPVGWRFPARSGAVRRR
ncbi:hypothetical protein [Nocardia arthritidis]|uniref:hypothetical protein n=1 Tax=Nocardia arthritidis TaxID=228602 RepID=UPI003D160B89